MRVRNEQIEQIVLPNEFGFYLESKPFASWESYQVWVSERPPWLHGSENTFQGLWGDQLEGCLRSSK